MSPILDIQRRLAEAGRIRPGIQVKTGGTRKDGTPATRPQKLDAWRFTSRNRRALEAAARLYGGQVRKWEDAPTDDQWELLSDASEIDVVLPPERMAFSQWLEEWGGGGCKRRCDGVTEQISNEPCSCDPDKAVCLPHTRLSLMLAGAPSTGLWRVESVGHNAKSELLGAMELAEMLNTVTGRAVLPAKLRLEHRKQIRDGKTRQFVVPTLDFQMDMAALATGNIPQLAGVSVPATVVLSQPSPAPAPALTPVPTDDSPAPSLPEQIAAVETPKAKPRRANAAPAVPATGRRPRSAAQAAAGEAAPIDEGVGSTAASGSPEAAAQDPVSDTAASSPPSRRSRQSANAKAKAKPNEQVPGWCRDLHIRATNLELDEAQFDAVVLFVTNDRTSSTKELTGREAGFVNECLTEIEKGELVLNQSDAGWSVKPSAA